MSIIHVVSVSGGKDSDATVAIALQRFGKHRVIPIFCDTGNEHELVYEHLDYLDRRFGITVRRLKADFTDRIAAKRMFIARDVRTKRVNGKRMRWSNKAKRRALAVLKPTGNPYLDLCMWKGRFPSRRAQFCTEELKRNIAVEFQLDLIEQGYQVVSWQGVRRDESAARANAKKFEPLGGGMFIYRPLVEWTAMDVFGFLAANDIEPNGLYRMGMRRVGCMPCINAGKDELKEIAQRFPEHIKRIEEWEWFVAECSKHDAATFVPAAQIMTTSDKAPLDMRQYRTKYGVRQVIEWAKTTRGGKQYDLLGGLDDIDQCSSAYGLCDKG